MWDVKS